MHKKLTIAVDEIVYDGLNRIIGRGRISQFIEDLVRPHVLGAVIEEGYRTMAADAAREREAAEWVDARLPQRSFNICNRNVKALARLPAQEQNQGRS